MTILIAGGGLSGLSLVAHLVARPEPLGPIVVVDDGRRSLATSGWAYWSAEPGLLGEAVSRVFDRFRVHAAGRDRIIGLGRYRYRFVRGDDLAAAVTKAAEKRGDVVFRQGRVTDIRQAGQGAEAVVDGERIPADWVFDSVLRPEPVQVDARLVFRGWHLHTPVPEFDPGVPTFFDFRTSQHRAASFVYVLPRGPQEALSNTPPSRPHGHLCRSGRTTRGALCVPTFPVSSACGTTPSFAKKQLHCRCPQRTWTDEGARSSPSERRRE